MSEERQGPGGPPLLGSLKRERKVTFMELLSLPPSERPIGPERRSSLHFRSTAYATVVDPHFHRWIDRVDEGYTMLLSDPPHCTKSCTYNHLFIRAISLPYSFCHSGGMEATQQASKRLHESAPNPYSSSARHPMVGHHCNYQGTF